MRQNRAEIGAGLLHTSRGSGRRYLETGVRALPLHEDRRGLNMRADAFLKKPLIPRDAGENTILRATAAPRKRGFSERAVRGLGKLQEWTSAMAGNHLGLIAQMAILVGLTTAARMAVGGGLAKAGLMVEAAALTASGPPGWVVALCLIIALFLIMFAVGRVGMHGKDMED